MPTPIDQLRAEHRIIEQVLRALTGLAERLARGEQVDANGFDRLFDFLATFADRRHHQREEKCLFPALGLHGVPRDRGPIGVMLQEHCTGRALISHMKRAASAYANGDPNAGILFAEHAHNYVDLLSQHIQKEDNVLFNVAERLFDERSMRLLQDQFDEAEAELGISQTKYAQEALEMERSWAPNSNAG
jgi:hemerythrin-like domain-containing protein